MCPTLYVKLPDPLELQLREGGVFSTDLGGAHSELTLSQ